MIEKRKRGRPPLPPEEKGYDLGAWLQKLREQRGWSLREAAEHIDGVSYAYLTQIEKGLRRFPKDKVHVFAKAYNLDAESILRKARHIIPEDGWFPVHKIRWAIDCIVRDPDYPPSTQVSQSIVNWDLKTLGYLTELDRRRTGRNLLNEKERSSLIEWLGIQDTVPGAGLGDEDIILEQEAIIKRHYGEGQPSREAAQAFRKSVENFLELHIRQWSALPPPERLPLGVVDRDDPEDFYPFFDKDDVDDEEAGAEQDDELSPALDH